MMRRMFGLVMLLCAAGPALALDWPQWQGPRRDGVWRETGIVKKFPSGGPVVKWRSEIGGGFSGPAIAGDRLYVMDRQGEKLPKGREMAKDGLPGKERVLCLNAATGKDIWKHEYDCLYTFAYTSGPRCTPVVHQGKVYTLGSMGDLLCFDAANGKVLWSKNLPKEYQIKPPFWGWATHPLVEGDKLFCLVGGVGSAVVAFNKDDGKEVWRALTVQEVGYAPPILIEADGKKQSVAQLIVWHTEALNSLDPETGKLFWSEKLPKDVEPVRPGITVGTPRKLGDLLFVSSPHHGSLMLKLDAEKPSSSPRATVLWRGASNDLSRPDGLHALMSSPALKDGHVYGVCAFGELRCLDALTGKRLWETYQPVAGKKTFFGTAFLVQHEDRFFIFNELGDLVIARLEPKGYEEIDRAHLLEPTLFSRGRDVVWSHPAFAHRSAYLRNDKEIICVSLAEG